VVWERGESDRLLRAGQRKEVVQMIWEEARKEEHD
jgi:hypothetical protein